MTREEAIKTWLPIISMGIDNMPELKEAFDMAIKALEQEPKSEWEQDHAILKAYSDGAKDILDKIREQIKSNIRGVEITLEVLAENDPLIPKMEGAKDTLENCLEIIDKAESEGEE